MALSVLLFLEVAAILGVGSIVYRIIYNLYLSPLKRFPGPLLYTATSIPFDIDSVRGNALDVLTRLHDQYGPVVRVRPNELSYIDGRVWKDVYGFRSHHQEWFKGDGLPYLNGVPGILSSPKDLHRRYRRSLAHAFSNQGLQEQAPRILGHVNRLVKVLAKHSQTGLVDMVQWFSWATTDIIGDLAFGESFGCLETEQEHQWSALTTKFLLPTLLVGILQRWHMVLLAPVLLPRDIFEGLRSTTKEIAEKLRKRADFKETKEGQEGVTFDELESNAQDLVFAGSETTAMLLTFTIYFLLRNPHVLAKVTGLIRSVFSQDSEITVASTTPSALPYLDAVLQETVRIRDPVPIFAPRVAPKHGDTIDGVFIPEGTRVYCAKYVAHRSELNFAKPYEFVPERWLPLGKEFVNDNRHNVFQPFSFGPRNCIGMNLAKAEMHLILAKLLWHFDFSPPEAGSGERSKWESWSERQKVMFLWVKPPMMVSIRTRQDLEVDGPDASGSSQQSSQDP
ncbi:putative Cytochrome P450 monooxygenase [Seiridium unicorne]|uniref:Cytochrome P450 monooxygenase n=1 Tax=Seiridium unicorne TaxID=138068 RepID=A0ABR2UFQ8_9PEZI